MTRVALTMNLVKEEDELRSFSSLLCSLSLSLGFMDNNLRSRFLMVLELFYKWEVVTSCLILGNYSEIALTTWYIWITTRWWRWFVFVGGDCFSSLAKIDFCWRIWDFPSLMEIALYWRRWFLFVGRDSSSLMEIILFYFILF